MSMIKQIIGAMLVLTTSLCSAAEQQETATLIYGSTTYPAEVADLPQNIIESDYPILLLPPSIGDKLAYCVNSGTSEIRRIKGVVVASNKLKCIDGPEVQADGETAFALLYALSQVGKMNPSMYLESEYLSIGRPKPHVVLPPGDYWTPEEKQNFQMKETQ